MTGQNELSNFKKMWTWLCAHPAHDREYYMKHVEKLQAKWINSCPLSNKSDDTYCDGCKMLWKFEKGTLCTDPSAPLYLWKHTELQRPDDRSFYASQVAVLAMRALNGQTS